MTEKKTVREMINEAIELYNKGEWNAAIALLRQACSQSLGDSSGVGAAEIQMHIGWNYWKKSSKDLAASLWAIATQVDMADNITLASAHAGLGIYYSEKGDKEKALHHAKLAQELLPENAAINQVMNLNACLISVAKLGDLKLAEEI